MMRPFTATSIVSTVFAFLLLSSSCLINSSAASSCVILDYDLSALSASDLHYATTNASYIYRPCQASPNCPSHSNFCRTDLVTPSHPTTALSSWPSSSAALHPVDTSASTGSDGVGVVLRTTQWSGHRCPPPFQGEKRVTVEWVCNPVADVPVLGVREENECLYDAAITTKLVCQTKKRPGTSG